MAPEPPRKVKRARTEIHEDLPDSQIPKDPKNYVTCPAYTRMGRPCRQRAGAKTSHLGVGYCASHGGNLPTHLIKLTREFVVSTYGDPIDIDPQEALLLEVQRTAGHVEWMRQLISEFGEQFEKDEKSNTRALTQYSPALGMTPSVWLQIYHEERKHLVNVAKSAIAAGVAERKVRIVEEQARQLAMMFKAFMMDERLNMTPAQRLVAPNIIRELVKAAPMEIEARASAVSILDEDVVDAEVIEES